MSTQGDNQPVAPGFATVQQLRFTAWSSTGGWFPIQSSKSLSAWLLNIDAITTVKIINGHNLCHLTYISSLKDLRIVNKQLILKRVICTTGFTYLRQLPSVRWRLSDCSYWNFFWQFPHACVFILAWLVTWALYLSTWWKPFLHVGHWNLTPSPCFTARWRLRHLALLKVDPQWWHCMRPFSGTSSKEVSCGSNSTRLK